ncbi:S8 family serine peptidase [Saxibacter everestensis]|uniref:S8 family serine peptidase n=1 Tax=Saxibacter everestensis TaxID=2909229 RepID=A0ABY8QW85_9MICO|nr:S8 family serine peptidase [Brevibacteriaceae bacterium ZFBP1038]
MLRTQSATGARFGAAVLAGAIAVTGFMAGVDPAAAAPDKKAEGLSTSTKKPNEKISPRLSKANGEISVFVRFTGDGAYEIAKAEENVRTADGDPSLNLKGDAKKSAREAQKKIEARADDVVEAVDGKATELYVTKNAIPGVAVRADAAAVRKLAERDDVESVTPIVTKSKSNKGTDTYTKAFNAWTEKQQTGKGATVAVIDSGLDYTHKDFGGPGTKESYEAAKKSPTVPEGSFDADKFYGGYDLAGDDYNADPDSDTYQPVPKPDKNPLDCVGESGGHGTHVAGSAAGYGVDAAGSTFDGDYTKLSADDVGKMKIGPGSAPEAQIVALRVFGCNGSSDVVGKALDFVLDPNADGSFADVVNVVNMSLGSDYSTVDDPENAIIDELTRHGVLSVVASGNAGDITDVGGSPGNARSALTVANSVGDTVAADEATVTAPEELAGKYPGQYSASFAYENKDYEGDVVTAPSTNATGCKPFSSEASEKFKGKWVWLEWDDNDATRECGSAVRWNNVEAAGGKGVVLGSTLDTFEAGIAGNSTIPGIQFVKSASAKLKPAAEAGTLHVVLNGSGLASATVNSNKGGTMNSSSSRGVHGSHGIVKPDISAPGTSIASAQVGSGNGGSVKSGTSMATPHVAGIAALMYGATSLDAAQIKAALMNTADRDVTVKASEGSPVYGPNRSGAGVVNALAAVSGTLRAAATDDPTLVSVNFGVLEAADERISIDRKVTVTNSGSKAVTLSSKFAASNKIPGVSIKTSGDVRVSARSSAEVTVTLRITDPKKLTKAMDASLEKEQGGVPRNYLADVSGRLLLDPGTAGSEVRVPVYSAPKPTSDMTAGDAVTFKNKKSLSTTIRLSGRDLDQGTGTEAYRSIVAPMELQSESPRLADDEVANHTARSADLQNVGVSSTVPALNESDGDVKDGIVTFGISTWGNWATLGAATVPVVTIDTNRDRKPDYQAQATAVTGIDTVIVQVNKLNPDGSLGDTTSQLPLNGQWGDVDTNVFDTNVATLPVPLAAIGLDGSKTAPFNYTVETYTSYPTKDGDPSGLLDKTKSRTFDPVNPSLWFTGSDEGPWFLDQAGATLTVNRAKKADKAKALFLHLHNATVDPDKVAAPAKATTDGPVSVQAKCVSDKVVLSVTVKNELRGAANVSISSPLGARQFKNVANGKSVTQNFNSGTDAISEGKVRVAVYSAGKGRFEYKTYSVRYSEFSCDSGENGKAEILPVRIGKK